MDSRKAQGTKYGVGMKNYRLYSGKGYVGTAELTEKAPLPHQTKWTVQHIDGKFIFYGTYQQLHTHLKLMFEDFCMVQDSTNQQE